ncbi:hypothetical protein [Salibacterium sp. K-3]
MFFMYEEMVDLDNEIEFTLHEEVKGHYDTEIGKWVDGSVTSVQVRGVIIPLSNRELQYYEAGTYNSEDMKVYSKKDMTNGNKIEYNGDTYELQQKKFNRSFADFATYVAKKQVVT